MPANIQKLLRDSHFSAENILTRPRNMLFSPENMVQHPENIHFSRRDLLFRHLALAFFGDRHRIYPPRLHIFRGQFGLLTSSLEATTRESHKSATESVSRSAEFVFLTDGSVQPNGDSLSAIYKQRPTSRRMSTPARSASFLKASHVRKELLSGTHSFSPRKALMVSIWRSYSQDILKSRNFSNLHRFSN
jgi:hypothetical protein